MYQWVYTSTCWGIEQQNGFQVFSHSEGLSKEESRELISRIGAYEFPMAASYSNDYVSPIAFSHVQLSTGKWVIAQGTPLGTGWMDGRGGNYIVHAVISDTPFEKNPMAYYKSPFFWKDLPEKVKREGLRILSGEKEWYSYGYMPDVEPSELVPNPEMETDALIAWCDAHSKWDLLAYLLEFFLERIQNKQNVIFRDDQTELPFIIGTLLSFLPENLASSLIFSTYMNTSNKLHTVLDQYHLIGVTESEADVCGVPQGEVKKSTILEVNREFNGPFQYFCAQTNVSLEQYKTAADVFLWCQGKLPGARVEDIPVFVQFLIQNDKKRTLFSDFIDELCQKHEDWFTQVHYEMLIEQLVTLVKNSSKSISLENLHPFFAGRLMRLLSAQTFNSLFDKTVSLCGPSFAMYWLSRISVSPSISSAAAAKVFLTVLSSIQYTKQNPDDVLQQNQSLITNLVDHLVKDSTQLKNILDKVPDSWFLYIWKKAPTKCSDTIAQSLALRPWNSACNIRLEVIKRGDFDRVWKEYQQASPTWELATFKRYYSDVLQKNEDFKQHYEEKFWKDVPLETVPQNELDWFLDEISKIADPENLKPCLRKLDMVFDHAEPDGHTEKQLQQYNQICENSQCYTSKKVNFLLWSLSSSVEDEDFGESLRSMQTYYKDLPDDQKQIWQVWWLKRIFKKASTKGQATFSRDNHQSILKFLCTELPHQEVLHRYVQVMSQTIDKFGSLIVMNLLLWSLTMASEEDSPIIQHELVDYYFYRCNSKYFQEIEEKIMQLKTAPETKKRLKERWEQFEMIWQRTQTFTGRITGKFRRFFR